MKVLQIAGTYDNAQKEIEAGIHTYLLQNGHDSYILYGIGQSSDPRVRCYETKPENLIRRFLWKYVKKSPHGAVLSTLRILRYIREIDPDIVHLHVLHHGYIDYPLLFRFLARKKLPVVFTMHDLWAATGGCYYNTRIQCEQYLSDCSRCPLEDGQLDCSAHKTASRLQQKLTLYKGLSRLHFVAVSPWLETELKKTQISSYPIDTVWNACNVPAGIARSSVGRTDDHFTILGVAACWDERKGLDRFFQLADMLGEQYQIILVGSIPDTARKSAPQNVRFAGSIADRSVLFQMYADADLHVTMSYEETFGLTLIEAALVGTKSMGFSQTAIPWVLGKTYGYVIENNDIVSMAAKIQEISKDPICNKLSAQQVEDVRAFFSTERMASGYLDIYLKNLLR